MQSVKALITLSCMGVFLSIECAIMNLFSSQSFYSVWMQDEISLAQLRRVMNVCYEKEIEGSSLFCVYQDEEVEFRYNGDFLYMTEGTWIFLNEVDSLYWEINDGFLRLYYFRAEDKKEAILGYE